MTRAVISNGPELANILSEAGADPDVVDRFGWTPLQHLQRVGHDIDLTSSLIRSASEAKRSKTAAPGAQSVSFASQ